MSHLAVTGGIALSDNLIQHVVGQGPARQALGALRRRHRQRHPHRPRRPCGARRLPPHPAGNLRQGNARKPDEGTRLVSRAGRSRNEASCARHSASRAACDCPRAAIENRGTRIAMAVALLDVTEDHCEGRFKVDEDVKETLLLHFHEYDIAGLASAAVASAQRLLRGLPARGEAGPRRLLPRRRRRKPPAPAIRCILSGASLMFLTFFTELHGAGVPVSLKEYLTLIEALKKGLAALFDGGILLPLARRAGEGRAQPRPLRPRLRLMSSRGSPVPAMRCSPRSPRNGCGSSPRST